jgi:WD40 repeat protein
MAVLGLNGGGHVRLFDPQTGKVTRTFAEPPVVGRSLAWSPDGRTLAVGSWDKKPVLLPVAR